MRDARRFGASEEQVEDLRKSLAASASGDLEIWPEHVAAIQAFLAADTQWRTAGGFGGFVYLGLDYAGARAGIEAAGIALTPELWADVRVMERAARAALNGNEE